MRSTKDGRLLVFCTVEIAASFEDASERLAGHLDELQPWIEGAFEYAEAVRAKVGIGGDRLRIAKTVRLEIGEPWELADGLLIPMQWEAESASSLFPRMDADLILTDSEGFGCDLSMRGMYSPPLGSVGEILDRLLLHRVAEATVRHFVEATAAAIAPDAPPKDAGES